MAYTKAQRDELTTEAVRLSCRGWSTPKIAEEIGVTEKTIRRWMDDEFSLRAEMRDQDKERAISRYEEIIRAAWERYDRIDDRSLNASGLLNTIRQAQESIDKITGAQAPKKLQISDAEYEVVWDDLDPSEILTDADEDEG
jgi:predicted transcriptional regulator